jgi:hypothetical protein
MQPVLHDTCAAVWIAENEKLAPQAVAVLRDVHQAGLPTYDASSFVCLYSRSSLSLRPLIMFLCFSLSSNI